MKLGTVSSRRENEPESFRYGFHIYEFDIYESKQGRTLRISDVKYLLKNGEFVESVYGSLNHFKSKRELFSALSKNHTFYKKGGQYKVIERKEPKKECLMKQLKKMKKFVLLIKKLRRF